MTDKVDLTPLIQQVAKVAAEWWGKRFKIDEKREAFILTLEDKIAQSLHVKPECLWLECDYDPRGLLLETVRAIGVECRGFLFSAEGILPQKHDLEIVLHETAPQYYSLLPKEGYGNWTEEFFVGKGQ